MWLIPLPREEISYSFTSLAASFTFLTFCLVSFQISEAVFLRLTKPTAVTEFAVQVTLQIGGRVMDRYQRVEKPRPETPISENEIRITTQGKMRNYITYATTLLQVVLLAYWCAQVYLHMAGPKLIPSSHLISTQQAVKQFKVVLCVVSFRTCKQGRLSQLE